MADSDDKSQNDNRVHGLNNVPKPFGHRDPRLLTRVAGAPEREDVKQPAQPPWNAVALLQFYNTSQLKGSGTGFLIGADIMLTAKHNFVYAGASEQQVIVDGIVVKAWLGYDDIHNPSAPEVKITGAAMLPSTDIAVMVLAESQPSFFSLTGIPPRTGKEVLLAGYSQKYANGMPRYTFSLAPISAFETPLIRYPINTGYGDSGAPVFYFDQGKAFAIGVHTDPVNRGQNETGIGNGAVHLSAAITQEIKSLVQGLRNQTEG